jgi:hypothetical protein
MALIVQPGACKAAVNGFNFHDEKKHRLVTSPPQSSFERSFWMTVELQKLCQMIWHDDDFTRVMR